MTSSRNRWIGPLALSLALAPTLVTAWQALAPSVSRAAGVDKTEREKILERIPSDPSVLINVKRRDMPAMTIFGE